MNCALSCPSLRAFALAATCTAPVLAQLPHTFVNGQVANANEVNANFESVDDKANAAQTGVNTLRSDVDSLTGTVNLLGSGQNTSNGRITTVETGLNSLLAPLGPLTPFADRLAIHRRLSFEPVTAANRKIVLSQTTADDNQFFGFGSDSTELRYQVAGASANHVFYAGNGNSSTELMRIQGDGALVMSSTAANHRVVLFPTAIVDQFYGLGVNTSPTGQLRYQVPDATSDHVFYAGATATATELMRIKGDGTVRIGSILAHTGPGGSTSGPQPTLVVGGTSTIRQYYLEAGNQYAITSGGPISNQPGAASLIQSVGIYVDGNIVAESYWAKSDQRIKEVKGHSDTTRDLATLMAIEVTDYQFIDTSLHGNRPQKKVLGQQVESVFPQAVTRSTNVVPDVYRLAPVRDGWITLTTDLCKGDHVRLIGLHKEGLHEVLETRPGAFRTDFVPDTDQVFVYGREVQDFRSVDYEAIAMLNVSATQELARRQEAKDAELAKLRAENEALRLQIEAQRTDNQQLHSQFEALAKDLAQLKASFATK